MMTTNLEKEMDRLSSLGIQSKDIGAEIDFRSLSRDEQRGVKINGPLSEYSIDQLYSLRSYMEQIESEIGMERYLAMRREEIKVLKDSYMKIHAKLSDPRNLVKGMLELLSLIKTLRIEYIYLKASMQELPELANDFLQTHKEVLQANPYLEINIDTLEKKIKASANPVNETIELVEGMELVDMSVFMTKAARSVKEATTLIENTLEEYKELITLYSMARTEATRPDREEKAKREADFDEKLKSMSQAEREAYFASLIFECPDADDLGLDPFEQ